jgi:hypothetical protein
MITISASMRSGSALQKLADEIRRIVSEPVEAIAPDALMMPLAA